MSDVTWPPAGVEPYYVDDAVCIVHGDCRDVLPKLQGPFDLVLTDPPYNVSSRNGRGNTTIGRVKRRHVLVGSRPDSSGSYQEIIRDFGEWDYGFDPTSFLTETVRLLRDGGTLIAFTSEFLFHAYLQSALEHRCMIYWHKPNPAPNFRGLYQRAVEMAVWQTKGGAWTFNAGGATQNIQKHPTLSGWYIPNHGEKRTHKNQKPLSLVRRWMDIHSNPGDLILDPFMGSGTMLRAAKDLGRRAVGIEIKEEDCKKAAVRMAQAALPIAQAALPMAQPPAPAQQLRLEADSDSEAKEE